MPFFCRSGHPVVTSDQFLDFVGHLLPQQPQLDLPRITGRDLLEVARAEESTAGVLDSWAWNEIKALLLPWFSVWLFYWNWLRPLVSGHKVFLMLFFFLL